MPASPQVAPGIYPGPGQASLLRPNQQQYLLQNTAINAGQSSIAVQLGRIQDAYPWGASFHFQFVNASGAAANPGAFTLNIQTSDIDNDTQFVTEVAVTSGLNANYVGRVELPSFFAKFVRYNLGSIANSGVYLTGLVTR
jgi:hypothetical protein